MNNKIDDIVKTFGNELAMHLTPSNESMKAVRFAREALTEILHQQLQKAREETIHRILAIVSSKQNQFTSTYERGYQDCVKNILESIHHYQSKLDKPN